MVEKIELKKEKKTFYKRVYIIFRCSIVITEALFVVLTMIYQGRNFLENTTEYILPISLLLFIGFMFMIFLFRIFPRFYICLIFLVFIMLVTGNYSVQDKYKKNMFLFSDIFSVLVFFFMASNIFYYKGFLFSVAKASIKATSKNLFRIFIKCSSYSLMLYCEFAITAYSIILLWNNNVSNVNHFILKLLFLGFGFFWIISVGFFLVYIKNYYFFVGASFLANRYGIYGVQTKSKPKKKLALNSAIKNADNRAESIFKATKNNLIQLIIPNNLLNFPNSQTLVRSAIYKKNYEESLDMTKEAFSSENLKPFRTWNLLTTVFLCMHFLVLFGCSWQINFQIQTDFPVDDSSLFENIGLRLFFSNIVISFALFAAVLPFLSFIGGIASCQLGLVVEAPEKLKKINKNLFEFFKNEDGDT